MLAKIAALGLENWTVEEKRELLDAVSDSLDEIDGEELDIPEWQKEEIDRRLHEHARNPKPTIPWREAMDLIEGGK